MREFGGYLPLELQNTGAYRTGVEVLALNSARNAVVMAYRLGGYTKLYLPFYMCESVKEALDACQVNYELYHMTEGFEPVDLTVGETEVMVYPSFYGVQREARINAIVERYEGRVILDNTQAFYQEPHPKAWNVYSARKFFGVSDGAYLIRTGTDFTAVQAELPADASADRALHLMKCYEVGTNGAYGLSLQAEEAISASGILDMSPLSHRILNGVDYAGVRAKRRANYECLLAWASTRGFAVPSLQEDSVPMVFPLVVRNPQARKALIEHKIYIPQWWKYVLGDPAITSFEEELSNYLLPLPVDQRYAPEDMCEMTNVIDAAFRERGIFEE